MFRASESFQATSEEAKSSGDTTMSYIITYIQNNSQLMSVISQIISLSIHVHLSTCCTYHPTYLSFYPTPIYQYPSIIIYIYRLFLCHLYVGLKLCLPLYVYLDHPISKSVCLSVCLSLYLFPSIYLLVLSIS